MIDGGIGVGRVTKPGLDQPVGNAAINHVPREMIVTGDVTQIDLPPSTTSGLIQAMQILKGVNGIGKIEFTKKDIVRHKLVQRIVEAYDKFDDKRKKEIKEAKEKKTNIDNN